MTLAELQARVGENVERGLRGASQDPPARTLERGSDPRLGATHERVGKVPTSGRDRIADAV